MSRTPPAASGTPSSHTMQDSFKIHITPFDGTSSKIEAFLDDMVYLWVSKNWDKTSHGQIMAASLFMSCTDQVKVNLRLLSSAKKHDVDALIKHLKETYGVQDREKITNCLDQLTTIQQGYDESLRDYITRARMLLDKLSEYQKELNLVTISNG